MVNIEYFPLKIRSKKVTGITTTIQHCTDQDLEYIKSEKRLTIGNKIPFTYGG